MIGQKPVDARLATLPEAKPHWTAMATSTIFQTAVVIFLTALPVIFPYQIKNKIIYQVTPLAPLQTQVLLPQERPAIRPERREVARRMEQPEPVIQRSTLLAPQPMAAPRPRPIETRSMVAPQVNQLVEARFEASTPGPARPREPVKTGLLTTGSAAAPTVDRPISQVQTGGFGDPRGLPGPSNPNRRPNIGRFGDPALPPGPGVGNGTGGASGVRGAVASAGFGNGVAIAPPSGSGGTGRGQVQAGGFATAAVATEAPRPRQTEAAPAVQPVVILAKPNPVYTEEARRLGLEGTVLVEVVFPASGPVRVLRVAKGLGHGLDEAAVQAAQQIRFKPALQNGVPVDFPATVHIVFQLAF